MTIIDGQLIREHIKQECQKYKSIFKASQKEVAIIRFEASENASNELGARYEAARISAEQKDDERDCFPAVLKIINKYKPKFAAIENVTGLLTCPYQPGDERGYFRYVLQQLGCLTIGQPSYLWSSADMGDAHLVDTEPSETLEETISTLKAKIAELLAAFS